MKIAQTMKFGLVVPNATGGVRGNKLPSMKQLKEFAVKAEKMEFDGLWVIDHLLTATPIYSTTWLDPIVTLSYLASVTESIRLGTSVNVLPLRIPAILAKEIASLDVVSNGRVICGVGNGWWVKEFEACNIPIETRGARVEEYVQILKKLWTEEKTSFDGKYYKFEDINVEPKPIQRPHPPIWIAGGSAAGKAKDVYRVKPHRVLKRVAKYADGWIARAYTNIQLVKNDWETIKRYAAEFGRNPSEIVFSQINWMILTDNKTDEEISRHIALSLNIPMDDVKRETIIGTARQIFDKVEELKQIGLQYLIIWPTHIDYGLLQFVSKDLMPSFG